MLFIYFVVPLLESVQSFLATWLEAKKAKYAAEVYKINKEITVKNNDKTSLIGFQYNNEEQDDEDYDEE